jgi:hypothetical protein
MKEGLRFDWYEKQYHYFFEPIVKALLKDCSSTFSNKSSFREKQLSSLIEVVISSLYSSYYSLPFGTQYISYPLSPKYYKIGDPTKVNFNSDYAALLFDILKDRKWINIVPGGQQQGHTRIKVSGRLKKLFIDSGLKWTIQEPKDRDKLIVLRDRKPNPAPKAKKKYIKFNVPVPETVEVESYKNDLHSFNQFLIQNCISLNLKNDQLKFLANELNSNKENETSVDDQHLSSTLDFSRVQLRRIFSRNLMTKGGRFYGGWWQSLPSQYRGHILINHKKTVEVDYSGMSLRIFAALQGKELSIDKDIYNLNFENWQGSKDSRRKPIKTFVNAMLNDEQGNYRLPKTKQALTGLTHNELKNKLFETYVWLEDAIHAGIGLDTQFHDSQIAMTVMKEMMADGILVLPIHDSFIVRNSCEVVLKSVMTKAFNTHLGQSIATSTDGSRLPKHFGVDNKDFEVIRPTNQDIVNLASVDIYSDDSSVMEGYVSSWQSLNKT